MIHKYVGKARPQPDPEVERRKAEKAKLDAEFVLEKKRQVEARRLLSEIAIAKHKRELIYRDEAVRQASFLVISLRQRLLGLARSLPRQLEGKTAHQMKLIIDEQVRACLTEMSELPNVITREGYERFVESE